MTSEQQQKAQQGIALFDFDGTLVPWDTQVLFADFVLKKEPVRRLYLPVFLSFLPMVKVLGDEGMKRVFLSYLWKVERGTLEVWAREFVEERIAGLLYPDVMSRLEEHRSAGHLTVLASASPEFYVTEVGRYLGVDLALGTVVEGEGRMRLFPDLENHKGSAKVRRLEGILGPRVEGRWPGSTGYTDSTADLPMMACCGEGLVVNPSARLTGIAEERGWDVMRPPVPWKGKADKGKKLLRFLVGAG